MITEPRGGAKGDFDELLQRYYDAILHPGEQGESVALHTSGRGRPPSPPPSHHSHTTPPPTTLHPESLSPSGVRRDGHRQAGTSREGGP